MSPAKSSPKPRTKNRNETPSEIAEGVFVGGWKDAVKFQGTRFCVLDELPEDMPPGTHIPIYDGGEDRALVANLERLASEMKASHAKGEPVLVYCGHGVRRGPLAGAWFLHRAEGISLDAAYERVRAVRPKIEHAEEWVGNAAELERA
jgi:protein-tyrosine phosphatase